jgi:hypothetical protein
MRLYPIAGSFQKAVIRTYERYDWDEEAFIVYTFIRYYKKVS